jgi:hypothetical protein
MVGGAVGRYRPAPERRNGSNDKALGSLGAWKPFNEGA